MVCYNSIEVVVESRRPPQEEPNAGHTQSNDAKALSLNPPIGCWRAWVAGLMPGWGRVGPSGVCWGVWGWGWGAFWVVDAGFVWGRQFRVVSFSRRVREGLAGR